MSIVNELRDNYLRILITDYAFNDVSELMCSNDISDLLNISLFA